MKTAEIRHLLYGLLLSAGGHRPATHQLKKPALNAGPRGWVVKALNFWIWGPTHF